MRDPLPATRALVERLARRGPDKYAFAPPLSEWAVASFERRAAVALPEEYRRFLREVSAGGRATRLGPPHLMTLAEAARNLAQEGGRLDLDFPITGKDAKRLIRADARCKPDAIRPAIHRDRDFKDGILPLMDLGGGEMDFLVVTGPERGRIWRLWEWGWSPRWRSVRGQPTEHDFFSWLRASL